MIFLATATGSKEIYDYMRGNFSSLGMCLLFFLWLRNNPKVLLKSFSFFQIYIYLNLITIILFPDGMYSSPTYDANWFLGYKNIQIRTILPIVAIVLINSYYQRNKLTRSNFFLIFCCILTFLLNRSSTSLVGFSIFILLFAFFRKRELPRIISVKTGIAAVAAFFVLIVVMKSQYMFAFFIEDVLHKDLTFTDRVTIWDRTLPLIKKSLALGYGYMTSASYVSLYKADYFTHPHNYTLYILMTGGLSLLTVLLMGYYFADKSLSATRESIYSKLVLFTLFSFLIMGFTEAITATIMMYPMLIMGMEIKQITADKNIKIQIERAVRFHSWEKILQVLKRISFTR